MRGVAAGLLTLLLAGGCTRPAPPVEAPTARDYDVPTPDGAVIHLHRHPAPGPPVILVHGVASNHRFWDLEPGRSLATWLSDRGFDTWCLDLRGHGDAVRAPGGRWLPRTTDMDDYGLVDAPTAIDLVRAETGAPRVAWVGHSMGGLVGAIYASQVGDAALWAYVAVASPADFTDPDPVMRLVRGWFGLGGLLLPVVFTPGIAIATERVGPGVRVRMSALLTTPGAIEPEAERRAFRTVSSPLWSGEMSQFAAMMRAGSFTSSDGDVDYLAALGAVRVPALVLAGRADQVAPPDRVRPLHDALGSPDRRFVVAGLENGFSLDYGHIDYGLADRAEAEIFPLVGEFLEAHAPR